MPDINHIAFIMDGNATWAKVNNKSAMDGYLAGMRTMSSTIISAKKLGLKYVTFYAFSSENWGRPQKWISDFMNLAMWFFNNDDSIKTLLSEGARLKPIGDTSKLNPKFQKILSEYEEKTKRNNKIIVQLAVSYGSRDEIVRTVRKLAKLNIEITEESISKNLDTSGVPDPQLIIRTSGKERLSNFLLWQASYSEFYFTKTLWPNFNERELKKAIDNYSKRKITYGK